jgi:hypothetical protein
MREGVVAVAVAVAAVAVVVNPTVPRTLWQDSRI